MINVSQPKKKPKISKSVLSVLLISDKDDAYFWARKLRFYPYPLQMRLARRFAYFHNNQISNDGKTVKFTANTYLRKTLARIEPRFGHIFNFMNGINHSWRDLLNVKRTEKRAERLAIELTDDLAQIAAEFETDCYVTNITKSYDYLADKCRFYGITPPFDGVDFADDEIQAASYEIAILKMVCEKWWKRKLKRYRLHALEWLEIATGEVSKAKNSPYASKNCLSEYKARQQSALDWMQTMELKATCFNEETNSFFENTISLEDAAKAGMANPENRRNELMMRMRCMEEYADELNYVGMFYTITAPSAYHANSDGWNGKSPKQTQQYFTKLWSQIRSKLGRLELEYFGVRVAEPHADGTPHWHMALFMPQKNVQAITAIIRKYAIKEDRAELLARYENREKLFKLYKKARQTWGLRKSQGQKVKAPQKFYRTFSPRFDAVKIDKSHGSATSYIAKYISKNIDGFKVGDHVDEETDKPMSESINPVAAWASNWNIRQFQFQGSPSVTVYRELRKINSPLHDKEMTALRYAADRGDWINFIKAMGGMNQGRKAKFKTLYEEIPEATAYNETMKKVKGVTNDSFSALSRVVSWELLKVGAANESWTCGNNCTQRDSGALLEYEKYG